MKNSCEARKIKASQFFHKIISTHLLTVLIISVILQLEQRKRDTKREKEEKTSGIRTPESSKETGKQKDPVKRKTGEKAWIRFHEKNKKER